MHTLAPDHVRILRTAAWIWISYLVALVSVDYLIYTGRPALSIVWYHMMNGLPAALFLGLAYSTAWSKVRPDRLIPWMILLISMAPILLNHLLDLRLPAAPLSNIEGMVLRQLPVLFIGLVLIAWHYNLLTMLLYSLGTNVFELLLTHWLGPFDLQRLNVFYFVTIIRTVSFAVVGIFINQLITRLRAQQDALRSANTELVHHASTLENLTISRERNRLALELHDTLAHTLSGLSVQLETARAYWNVDSETAYRLLVDALSTTRSGLEETRRALKALRASPLEDLGLRLALQELATAAAGRCRLELDLDLPEQIPALSPDIEQCLYRVAQEAIENVNRHANASKLWVQLDIQETGISLGIEDNGVGFDQMQAEPAAHFGLAGMRERAQRVGGQLTISSRLHQGTRVQLFIARIST